MANDIQMQLGFQPVRFDIPAFDSFIKENGIVLEHFKAMPCPLGIIDQLDGRSPHHEHGNCSNGYLYFCAGTVTATFTNNSALSTLGEIGIMDGSIVNVTFPRFYDDQPDKQVYIQLYDRFYIKACEVLVPNSQRVEAHLTGIDKMTYIVKAVEKIVDSNNKEYFEGDFSVQDGNIVWIGQNRPGFDLNVNKGTIYSIRYLYTPFFYASRIMHEVRIARAIDFMSGESSNVRVPYAVALSREYYLYKTENSENGQIEDSRRDLIKPRDGSFGPR